MGGPPSLGPPTADDELFSGWLENALNTVLAPIAPPGRFELRIGDEVASLVDGEAQPGPVEQPDVVVEGEPEGVYRMFGDRRLDLGPSRETAACSSSSSPWCRLCRDAGSRVAAPLARLRLAAVYPRSVRDRHESAPEPRSLER